MGANKPLVTVGLPVWNGGPKLAGAITALLEQQYSNLEIVISDNASDDETEDVCRSFAKSDDRIRYFRLPQNIGAVPNFNLAFEKAHGEFFAWATHDDSRPLTFVGSGVDALVAEPAAIGWVGTVAILDERGEHMRFLRLAGLASDRVNARVRTVFRSDGWFAVYGLFRRHLISEAMQFLSVEAGDALLIFDLILRDRFVVSAAPSLDYSLADYFRRLERKRSGDGSELGIEEFFRLVGRKAMQAHRNGTISRREIVQVGIELAGAFLHEPSRWKSMFLDVNKLRLSQAVQSGEIGRAGLRALLHAAVRPSVLLQRASWEGLRRHRP